ncbi:MAG TPA: PA domain-containing protein, partial [Solirubrobacter sp.]|nr:PA domain-containing protein [Solirubrobacter sp.]
MLVKRLLAALAATAAVAVTADTAHAVPPTQTLHVLDSSAAGAFPINGAAFGPASYEVEGPIQMASGDGCAPLAPAPQVVLMIDRGVCTFAQKAQNAQAAGALAAVVVDNVEAANPPFIGGTAPEVT